MNHVSMNICQPSIDAVMPNGELEMINPEEMNNLFIAEAETAVNDRGKPLHRWVSSQLHEESFFHGAGRPLDGMGRFPP